MLPGIDLMLFVKYSLHRLLQNVIALLVHESTAIPRYSILYIKRCRRRISHTALRSLYLTTEASPVPMQFSGISLTGTRDIAARNDVSTAYIPWVMAHRESLNTVSGRRDARAASWALSQP